MSHPRRGLKPFQLLGVFKLLKFNVGTRGGFLADEQGLGKTAQALTAASPITLIDAMADDFYRDEDGHRRGTNKNGRCRFARNQSLPFVCVCHPDFPPWLRTALES